MKMRPEVAATRTPRTQYSMSFQVTTLSGIRRKISPGGLEGPGDCIGGDPDTIEDSPCFSFALAFRDTHLVTNSQLGLDWARTPGSKEDRGFLFSTIICLFALLARTTKCPRARLWRRAQLASTSEQDNQGAPSAYPRAPLALATTRLGEQAKYGSEAH